MGVSALKLCSFCDFLLIRYPLSISRFPPFVKILLTLGRKRSRLKLPVLVWYP